jgi:serine/threonine protein phosphatase PrpC
MGSDGIFDNLFDEDIIQCLKGQFSAENLLLRDPQRASDCLSLSAEIKGYDPTYDSAFAQEARAHGRNHPGGKADDITVVVS